MSALRTDDLQTFWRLSIPQSLVERARIERVDCAEAFDRFGVNTHGDGGIVIPYYTLPNGQPSQRVSCRVRLDNPKRGENGKAQKYASAYGDKRHLYIPPVDSKWTEDTSTPVIFVEAEKSALAILRWAEEHGRPLIPVALGGCYGWSGKTGIKTAADGERIEEHGPLSDLAIAGKRRAYVAFDSNVSTKKEVYLAREKFIEVLLSLGCDVRVLELPASEAINGPDDLLGSKDGDTKFFELFEAAEKRSSPSADGESLMADTSAALQSKPIQWMWRDRIPAAAITAFNGPPDHGKSTVGLDIAARYSTGRTWPDGTPNDNPPGRVLLLVSEDGAAEIIKPRLVAASADVSRVSILKQSIYSGGKKTDRLFALDHDLHLLERMIVESGFGLVIIDPFTTYLGKAKMNDEQEMRKILIPLRDMCERTGVTVILSGHFNKRSDVSALHRVAGAVANSGVPRAVWLFMKDPRGEPGDMLFLSGKGNFTRKKSGIKYRFADTGILCDNGEHTSVPTIQWGDAEDTDADATMEAASNPYEKAQDRAEAFLKRFLADGEKPSAEVIEAATKAGNKERTLWRAKTDLHITTSRQGGVWWWRLP